MRTHIKYFFKFWQAPLKYKVVFYLHMDLLHPFQWVPCVGLHRGHFLSRIKKKYNRGIKSMKLQSSCFCLSLGSMS